MGDRTHVTLTVHRDYEEQVQELLTQTGDEPYDSEVMESDGEELIYFNIEDVNYGEVNCLDKLQELGIAYDSEWAAGDEYGEGQKSLRFSPEGNAIVKQWYEYDLCITLHHLNCMSQEYLSNDQLAEQIRLMIANLNEKCSLFPWTDQIRNGKTYRAKQLLIQ
jgi:hypothetical protein